jgi:hypothetical protein
MTARTKRAWTPEDVVALGVRTTVPIAGDILGGLTKTEAYDRVHDETFPVPVFPIGRKLVVPVQPILDLLGIKAQVAADPDPAT